MSKTRKRVLSALAILFAAALVFTACLALTGCGDSEDDWPEDWTEYKFAGTQEEEKSEVTFYLWSDGTTWFGTDAMYPIFQEYGQGGTNGWWGYVDGELTFVKHNGSGDYDSSIVEMKTSGNSVTLGWLNGSQKACTVTIDDIGCLAGNTGYDFSGLLVEGEYDVTTGVLTV